MISDFGYQLLLKRLFFLLFSSKYLTIYITTNHNIVQLEIFPLFTSILIISIFTPNNIYIIIIIFF